MDSLTQSVTELTGSVGALMVELKRAEARIRQLEQMNDSAPAPVEIPLRGPSTEDELKEVGRLPDSVRDLEIFEGDPVQYVYWVHSVEGILDDYKIVRGKPIYRAILKTIRGKIRGKANAALISHNIFDSDWPAIKACLSLHYADKRDIRTLEHQLGQLAQGNSNLDEFYAKVNHQFSLIINKLKSGDYSAEVVDALIETYRNRALDVFVRGLRGDLSRMIIVQRPRTLPEAYTACLDIQNLNFRTFPIHGPNTRNVITVPRNEMSMGNGQVPRRANFNSGERYNRNWGNNSGQSRNYRPHQRSNYDSRNDANLATPAIKMEVDGSGQTRRTNNSSTLNPFKRRIDSTNDETRKFPRLYNIETNIERDSVEQTTQEYENSEKETNFMEDGPPAFFI